MVAAVRNTPLHILYSFFSADYFQSSFAPYHRRHSLGCPWNHSFASPLLRAERRYPLPPCWSEPGIGTGRNSVRKKTRRIPPLPRHVSMMRQKIGDQLFSVGVQLRNTNGRPFQRHARSGAVRRHVGDGTTVSFEDARNHSRNIRATPADCRKRPARRSAIALGHHTRINGSDFFRSDPGAVSSLAPHFARREPARA
jgi:hypothetical protein